MIAASTILTKSRHVGRVTVNFMALYCLVLWTQDESGNLIGELECRQSH
jgi:hypothetical protein